MLHLDRTPICPKRIQRQLHSLTISRHKRCHQLWSNDEEKALFVPELTRLGPDCFKRWHTPRVRGSRTPDCGLPSQPAASVDSMRTGPRSGGGGLFNCSDCATLAWSDQGPANKTEIESWHPWTTVHPPKPPKKAFFRPLGWTTRGEHNGGIVKWRIVGGQGSIYRGGGSHLESSQKKFHFVLSHFRTV